MVQGDYHLRLIYLSLEGFYYYVNTREILRSEYVLTKTNKRPRKNNSLRLESKTVLC